MNLNLLSRMYVGTRFSRSEHEFHRRKYGGSRAYQGRLLIVVTTMSDPSVSYTKIRGTCSRRSSTSFSRMYLNKLFTVTTPTVPSGGFVLNSALPPIPSTK